MYEAELKELTPNQWELFAEDILFHLGFVGYVGPSVGADEGLDMLVERDDVRYLVSCKHYLVSGRNVGPSDEQDISDRLRRHDCEGFIAIYSTQPTSALKRKLLDLSKRGVKVVELYKSDVMDSLLFERVLRPPDQQRIDVLNRQSMHFGKLRKLGMHPSRCLDSHR